MLILDCKPEEIKNIKPLLAHAYEIDIDKELNSFMELCPSKCPPERPMGDCKNCRINHLSFSQFLQDKLKQEGS